MESLTDYPMVTNWGSFTLKPPFIIKGTDFFYQNQDRKLELVTKSLTENVL